MVPAIDLEFLFNLRVFIQFTNHLSTQTSVIALFFVVQRHVDRAKGFQLCLSFQLGTSVHN
ncbi:hypothetical protein E2986_09762 [Frieseomelitta varia]|uniref:Uncharacterized protein n=1 Tax=Frieseomelitta varia TaxID=561572 RepID=A0A833SB26_9HYME|nr:hypothetical protein E2986_09762 [Frieseomelitta varia]